MRDYYRATRKENEDIKRRIQVCLNEMAKPIPDVSAIFQVSRKFDEIEEDFEALKELSERWRQRNR